MLGDGIFISAYVSNCHATLAAASHPRGGALRLPILTFRPGARLSQMKVTKTCSIWATAMVNTMADLGNYCNQALGIHIGLMTHTGHQWSELTPLACHLRRAVPPPVSTPLPAADLPGITSRSSSFKSNNWWS